MVGLVPDKSSKEQYYYCLYSVLVQKYYVDDKIFQDLLGPAKVDCRLSSPPVNF